MSQFLILCEIDPARLDLFEALRAAHYEFLIAERARIVFGGPARASSSEPPATMMIVIAVDSLDAATEFIAREPYNRNGGFTQVIVRHWNQVLPETEPGALAQALTLLREDQT